ncbi:MAG: serine/threonine-protein kinase [Candidatus Eisenbacteria bacterium]
MSDRDRLQEIFARALELREGERAAYLDQSCRDDRELRAQVESLLVAAERAGSFLERTVEMEPRAGDAAIGSIIGRYKLLEEIGEGGFGVVYMAEQLEPVHRMVALKVLKAGMDTREVIARFEAERQALALMDHPNIARVLDAGATAQGRPYFVMELVRGLPITEYCDRESLPSAARVQLFIQVCRAVQHAHQKGIIHRDLKPGNVLVTVHDGEPVPKVIDFGVAKAIGARLTEKTLFTRLHEMIGTPAYMSPEQAELSGLDIDTRSDIYSLGVLLYEILTGAQPFEAESLRRAALDEMRRILREDEPPKPSTRLQSLGDRLDRIAAQRHTDPATLTKQVRGDLDWIVMKAMEKDRRRRYETPDALAADLARHLEHEPVTAAAPSAGYRARKFLRRNRAAVIFGGLLGGVIVAGGLLATWQAVRATRAERAEASLRTQAEARAAVSRAALLARTGHAAEAESLLHSLPPLLARLEPEDAVAIHGGIGDWRARRGEWKEASAAYRALLAADPEQFDALDALSLLALAAKDTAAYRELRLEMVARFAETRDPLVADRLVADCLLLPWPEAPATQLEAAMNLALTVGEGHADWRSAELAKGLLELRRGRARDAGAWLAKVAESGEWQRNAPRDVAAAMYLALAQADAGEVARARGTFTDALAYAHQRLPAREDSLPPWPEWRDWIVARQAMAEATRRFGESTAPATDGARSSPPASLTILPVLLAGRPFDRIGEVVGMLLEQEGLANVELGELAFDPGSASNQEALVPALSAFLANHPPSTELTLYAEYNGTREAGITELRAFVMDRAGALKLSDRVTRDDEALRRLEGPDPLAVSVLLVQRLAPRLGLTEATRRAARPGKLSARVRERSGLPPEDEIAAMAPRAKRFVEARKSSRLAVLVPQINGASDAAGATAIARALEEAGHFERVTAMEAIELPGTPDDPNELKRLWSLARALRERARAQKIDADYLLAADFAFDRERWERGFLHVVISDRAGDWVWVDLQNSEQADYQAVKPLSTDACVRLLGRRIAALVE